MGNHHLLSSNIGVSNFLLNSGEFGITAVYNTSDGIISNNTIDDCDGAAIAVGSALGNNEVSLSQNVSVLQNIINSPGVNRRGDLAGSTIAGIRVWATKNITLNNNIITNYKNFGIFFHDYYLTQNATAPIMLNSVFPEPIPPGGVNNNYPQ